MVTANKIATLWTRSYLYALVSVRHHRNQERHEHHDRHQQVGPEDELEQVLGPGGSHAGDVVQV